MRIAALYDIHGNLPALEAVLGEIAALDDNDNHGVSGVVVGGDVVPGPLARECLVALLDQPLPVQFIQGNGERDVLALHRGAALTRVPEQHLAAMRWVAEDLAPEQLDALASWPLTLTSTIPALGRVQFCHATPRDDNEIFTRNTPAERLEPIFAPTSADVVICGHTHMQFDRRIGAIRVVNAGSVGMPFGTPGAFWALLGPDIELRCTRYDLTAARKRLNETAYPQASAFDPENPPSEQAMLEVFEKAALG